MYSSKDENWVLINDVFIEIRTNVFGIRNKENEV